MEWDERAEDDADDGPVAPLLPQEDRLWRHPSEMLGQRAPKQTASRDPRLTTIVALTSTISVLLTLGVVAVVRPGGTKVAVQKIATTGATGTLTGLTDVAEIAERLRPSITRVQADGPSGTRSGSGVVYRSDGMMLTSQHIIDGARTLHVSLDDGRQFTARLIGADPETDIALLDIDGDRFPVAALGSASSLKAGQPAITIGSPYARAGGPVVSVGVVSAMGQELDARGMHLMDMIQTDAAVSPGCSGGAVVDSNGIVIGIATTSAASPDGQGSGYATPIDVARIVAAQLLTHGRVTRGWLGVEGDSLPADRADELGITGGVVVKSVKDASPAVTAGLVPADVIASIDGQPVRSMTDLVVSLRTRRPGDTVAVSVVHAGAHDPKTVKVTLAERP
jgi:S1-C subfamily serine protease